MQAMHRCLPLTMFKQAPRTDLSKFWWPGTLLWPVLVSSHAGWSATPAYLLPLDLKCRLIQARALLLLHVITMWKESS